jgi:hemerythrin-like metal-binding protein
MLAASLMKGNGMPELQWSDSYTMDLPVMDDTHREFMDLLAKVVRATDAQLMPLWEELVAHTDAHFAREDRWMTDTGFSPTNCHSTQHQVVLKVMREGSKRGGSGDLAVVRQMADELGVWFPQHASAMDAALAQHLQSVNYDEKTGLVHLPQALPTVEIEGCHGSSCTTHEEPGAKLETT